MLFKKWFLCFSSLFIVWSGLTSIYADTRKKYNVILIIVDSLRADHLGCYGYTRNTSTYLDQLARESIFFEKAFAQAPTTLLSFTSLLTGQYVETHGVSSVRRRLSDDSLTLPEIARIYNYKTAAFLGGPCLDPVFGLNQGFDIYSYVGDLSSSFKRTFPEALQWIKNAATNHDRFFALIHGNDLHPPYVFPQIRRFDNAYHRTEASDEIDTHHLRTLYRGRIYRDRDSLVLSAMDRKHLVDRYDDGIVYVDNLIRDFMYELKQQQLLKDTIIIVTADHGEELFDHDYYFHEFNLYEGTIRVPLMIKIPEYHGQRVRGSVQLIDVAPTLLDILHMPVSDAIEGKSVFQRKKVNPRVQSQVCSQSSFGSIALRWNDRWKMIKDGKDVELYDVAADPAEVRNVTAEKSDIMNELLKRLDTWLVERRQKTHSDQRISGDKGIIQKTEDIANDISSGVQLKNRVDKKE